MDELRRCFQTMGYDPLVGCKINLQINQLFFLKKLMVERNIGVFALAVNFRTQILGKRDFSVTLKNNSTSQ